MGLPRQEYWSGLPFLLQGIFLTQGSNPHLLHWQAGSLFPEAPGSPLRRYLSLVRNAPPSPKHRPSPLHAGQLPAEAAAHPGPGSIPDSLLAELYHPFYLALSFMVCFIPISLALQGLILA